MLLDLLKTDSNAKITEIKIKIPSRIGSATASALTAVKKMVIVQSKIDMTQKHQALNLNILLQLITIDLQMKELI